MTVNEEGECSDKSDDDLGCLSNLEDEGGKIKKHKLLEFDKDKDMENPRLVEGMVFPTVTAFRALLKEFHIREGCQYTYLKNEATRVTVICKEECGFRLHASPMHGEKSFQIKKIRADHSCTRKYINKYATSKWIAGKYMDVLTDEPDKNVKTLKNDVKRDWMLDVSRKKVYRARRVALETIQGSHEEQYLRLRDYCQVLINKNPGSTALLKVERVNSTVLFQRLFICFDAQAKGFLAGCRPFIGLDACFLKGPYGGQLMAAVGRDANNQMYPLCVAIVEAELKDSWGWFLEHLMQVIGRPEERGWCFMSDRQKGLVEAFKRLMPTVEHRFCLRHMYANFNKTYKGKEYKDLFWGAASAYTVPEFNTQMAEMKRVDKKAHEWMLKEEKKVWARAYYSPRSKVNRMDNNMSECFNRWIEEARDKPILTVIETIRRQLMVRYVQRLAYSQKFKGKLCPNIGKKVEKKKVKARGLAVIYSGGTVFEVTSTDKTFVRTYSYRINPIPDKTLWPQTECDPILPPPFRSTIGRPKKARRKGEDEPNNPYKVRKHSTTIMCRKCGQFGHNVRTCKTPQESWVNHKAKYYGKQKAKFGGGVQPAGKPKGSGSGTVGRGRGGRGRGTGRGRGRGIGRGRGGGIESGSASAASGSVATGKRKAVDQPQQNQASKRLTKAGERWLPSQQSNTSQSKFTQQGTMTRNDRVVTTISSQASCDPTK